MSKQLRRRMVEELVRKCGDGRNYVLVGTQSMTANQTVELRRELREGRVRMTVLKNSVAHHAFERLGLKDLQRHLSGMNALLAGADAVVVAKKLMAFRERTQKPDVKAAVVEGKLLGPEAVTALSKLPGRPEMLATLLGTLRAPAQQFVGTLNECVRSFLGVLAAIEDKQKGAAPAAAPPA